MVVRQKKSKAPGKKKLAKKPVKKAAAKKPPARKKAPFPERFCARAEHRGKIRELGIDPQFRQGSRAGQDPSHPAPPEDVGVERTHRRDPLPDRARPAGGLQLAGSRTMEGRRPVRLRFAPVRRGVVSGSRPRPQRSFLRRLFQQRDRRLLGQVPVQIIGADGLRLVLNHARVPIIPRCEVQSFHTDTKCVGGMSRSVCRFFFALFLLPSGAQQMNQKADSRLPFAGPYVAVPNSRLNAIVRNGSLPLRDRFDALLLLTSLGNGMAFACYVHRWEDGSIRNVRPLRQIDFAQSLDASQQQISDVVKLRRKQGLLKPPGENPRLLEPVLFSEKAAAV